EESSRLGKIRDVVVDNIIAHVRGTSTITGHTDQPLENIRISNVQIYMTPENARDKRSSHALKIERVHGLTIRDLSVHWTEEQTEEKWGSALVLKSVSGFDIASFSGRQGLKASAAPTIHLENASEGILRDSRAAAGTGTFLHLAGSGTK